MSTFRKALREFASGQIAQPGEHKRHEIAQSFLDEHPTLAAEYVRELASKQVAELIKELCEESEADPLPIFAGFPLAISIMPGIVKATAQCLLDDLGAGLVAREKNIGDAMRSRDRYRDSMNAYEMLRASEAETVGECAGRLRVQGPVGPPAAGDST